MTYEDQSREDPFFKALTKTIEYLDSDIDALSKSNAEAHELGTLQIMRYEFSILRRNFYVEKYKQLELEGEKLSRI